LAKWRDANTDFPHYSSLSTVSLLHFKSNAVSGILSFQHYLFAPILFGCLYSA